MKLTRLPFILMLLAVGSFVSMNVSAVTYYLEPNGSGDGSTWEEAAGSWQELVEMEWPLEDGDVVLCSNGVYDVGGLPAAGSFLTNRFCITNQITVKSVNGPEVTIIKGASSGGGLGPQAVRCAYLENGAQLIGFTLTNGYTLLGGVAPDRSGAGLLMMTNCVASNLVVIGNHANLYGGGAMLMEGGRLLNSQILTNRAGSAGGGVYLRLGGEVSDCRIQGNTGEGSGGGVYCDGVGGVVNNSIISTNEGVAYGGGIHIKGGGTVNNGLICNNWSDSDSSYGGGILFETVGGTLNNCTIVGNHLTGSGCYGGGVCCFSSGIMNNCIIYNNTADNGTNIYYFAASTVRNTCAADGVTHGTDGCITNNPLFVNAANLDFQIQNTSPCINAGTNTYAPTNVTPVDLAGNLRIVDTIVDMGAYEVQSVPAVDVVYVDASRPDDTGAGTNWATAKRTIQAGVDAVSTTGTVWVTNGVYDAGGAVTPGYALTNRVCITNAIVLQSVNGPAVTVIKGAAGSNGSNDVDSIRGVFMDGGCALNGFTVTNGYTMASGNTDYDRSGGGVWMTTNCTASNLIVRGNSARRGGGVCVEGAGAALNNSTVSDNLAMDSVGGGGILLYSGASVNNCTLNGNSSGGDGGGALLFDGGTLNNCLVSENTANTESASIGGGGVYIYLDGIVNNCTVSSNTANGDGDGIYMDSGEVNNSIVWEANNAIYNDFGSPVRYTCASDGVTHGTDGCITNDPLFVDAPGGDYRLSQPSPCFNTGDNIYAPTNVSPNDLAGIPRIIDGTVDMGAYEVNIAYADASRADDSGDGRTWATAKKTIQAALNIVTNGSYVFVTNGTYNLISQVEIMNTVMVQSVNGPAVTIIDGGDSVRCVWMTNGVLSGFTLTNGSVIGSHGGGAMLHTGCIMTNCVLSGNTASGNGGGAYLYYGGTLNNCSINGNTGGNYGGGICTYQSGTVNNCVVNDNAAANEGGGVAFLFDGTANNCLINGNTCDDGGGVCLYFGGTLNNSSISDNAATNQGGGIFLNHGGTINNSISWENTAGTSGNDIYDDSGTAIRYTCASDGLTHGVDNCITNNPLFVDALSEDFALQSTSPCLNMGNNVYAPTNVSPVDLAGDSRIMFDMVDMGAYEVQYILSVDSGPYAGGNSITITNGTLGNGSDITNVIVGGVVATITGQGANWVTIILPAASAAGTVDIVVQSTSEGDTTFSNAYTYNPQGVFADRTHAFPAYITLTNTWLNGTNGSMLVGAVDGILSGWAAKGVGDVNVDGLPDFLIGASDASPEGQNDAGEAYLVYGRTNEFPPLNILTNTWLDGTNGIILAGDRANIHCGLDLGRAGDVNGDGFDDMIISANFANSSRGETYLIYGRTNGFPAYITLTNTWLDGTNGVTMIGATTFENSGTEISMAGDVNGDGLSDLLIGAYDADPEGRTKAGTAYLVYGQSNGLPATINFSTNWLDGTNGIYMAGGYNDDGCGRSVSDAGDVNGDGLDDFLVGAANYSTPDQPGEVYLIFGQTNYGLPRSMTFTNGCLDGTNGVLLAGDAASYLCGVAVSSAGDINRDNLADFLIGAPYANSKTGEAYLVYGRTNAFPATVILTNTWLDGTNGIKLVGNNSDDECGHALSSAGDVNGDGLLDLLIGAPEAHPRGISNAGETYVIYGRTNDLPPLISMTTNWLNGTNGIIMGGVLSDDNSGSSVNSPGDVNSDGLSDILIGAHYADPFGQNLAGETYLVYGTRDLMAVAPDSGLWKAGYQVILTGSHFGNGSDITNVTLCGSDVTSIDSQSATQVVVTAAIGTPGLGDVIIYSTSFGTTIKSNAFTYIDTYMSLIGINGEYITNNAMVSTAKGTDFGKWDYGIIVTNTFTITNPSPSLVTISGVSTNGSESDQFTVIDLPLTVESGTASNFFVTYDVNARGSANASVIITNDAGYYPFTLNLRGMGVPLGTNYGPYGSPSWVKTGVTDTNIAREARTIGDINGDGYDDLLVGASSAHNGTGMVFLYTGSATGLSTEAVATILGENPNEYFGDKIAAAGDVNGDGYDDALIGAGGYYNGNSRGRVSLFTGSPSGLTGPAVAWTGEYLYVDFGFSIDGAGDVNGDGYDDVVIGAFGYTNNNMRGKCYVYYGSENGPGVAPDWTMEGETAFDKLGYSVAGVGDVNNDGYDDVVLGAYAYSGGDDRGKGYLYLGDAGGLSSNVTSTGEGVSSGDSFMRDCAGVGDINGDGYDDVIVSAPRFDNYEDRGCVYLFLGQADGDIFASTNWTITGENADDSFGEFLTGVGDVNADGYDDFLVGAPDYPSEAYYGRAYLYFGNTSGAPTLAWADTGEHSDDEYGKMVAALGDVNGDGYNDIAVGAEGYDTDGTWGKLYAYYGDIARPAFIGIDGSPISGDNIPTSANGTAFDLKIVGTATTNVLAITSLGISPFDISSAVTNGDETDFSISGLPATVIGGTSYPVSVTFSPSALGALTAQVVVANSSTFTPFNLNLSGRGMLINTNQGSYLGGTTVTITNGTLGDGSDITNITVKGVQATIVTQGTDWVTFTVEADPNEGGYGDIIIQSTSAGNSVVINGFYYTPAVYRYATPTSFDSLGTSGDVINVMWKAPDDLTITQISDLGGALDLDHSTITLPESDPDNPAWIAGERQVFKVAYDESWGSGTEVNFEFDFKNGMLPGDRLVFFDFDTYERVRIRAYDTNDTLIPFADFTFNRYNGGNQDGAQNLDTVWSNVATYSGMMISTNEYEGTNNAYALYTDVKIDRLEYFFLMTNDLATISDASIRFNFASREPDVIPSFGPYSGGNMITMTNAWICNIGITNVTFMGMDAVIVDNGANWVSVTVPAVDIYMDSAADVLIQSESMGDWLLPGGYTYLKGQIGISEVWENIIGLLPDESVGYGAVAALGDYLYTIGGNNITNVYRYDGSTWTETVGLPFDLKYNAAATYSNRIYCVGGDSDDLAESACTNVLVFDGTNWSETVGLPEGRRYNGAAVLDGYLYCVGGQDPDSTYITNVYRFNGTVWDEVAGMPEDLGRMACASAGGYIYVAGGYDDNSYYENDLFRFDGSSWVQLEDMDEYLGRNAGASLGTTFYSIGGYDGSTTYSEVFGYNGVAWFNAPSLPDPRRGIRATTWRDRMYAIGGYESAYRTNVYRYPASLPNDGITPNSGSWTGGYQVTILGIGLGNGSDITNVTLCGVEVASIDSQSSTQVIVTAVAGTPGLGDVRVFSVSHSETIKSNAFTYTGPVMQVQGTNGAIITSGEAASAAKGTAYAPLTIGAGVTNTFSITNSGNAVLIIDPTDLSDPTDFSVAGIPATVDVGAISNFTSRLRTNNHR